MDKKIIYFVLSVLFIQINPLNAQWLKTSTDSLETMYDLAICNNNLIVATHTKGVLLSSDKGNTWHESNTGLTTNYIEKIYVDNNIAYLTTSGLGIYKSTDGGNSWQHLGEGVSGLSYVYSLAAKGNNLFVAVNDAVIKSSDGGVTWDTVNTGLDSIDVRTVFILGNEVFASIYNDGLYRSSIDNINWVKVSDGLSADYWLVRTMVVSPTDSNKIYIGTNDGVFYSDDGGTNWVHFDNGMDGSVVSFLVYERNRLFAGMGSGKGGVMVLEDSTWIYKNEGLPEYPYLRGIAADSSNLYIISYKEKFVRYQSLDKITSIDDRKEQFIPKDFVLLQNYPNPFNPTTTIQYTIPVMATHELPLQNHVKLKIYDVLGKEVATLVNKEQVPGNYKVVFDASNLSSGVYYYQLKAGNFIETKKMILLR